MNHAVISGAGRLGFQHGYVAFAAKQACVREARRSWWRSSASLLIGTSPLGRAAAGWHRLASAEIDIAAELVQLGSEWSIFHSVPVVGGVLSHVVIGPAGVFCLHARGSRDDLAGQAADIDGLVADAVGGVKARSVVVSTQRPTQVTKADDVVCTIPLPSLVGWLHAQASCLSRTAVEYMSVSVEERFDSVPRGHETVLHDFLQLDSSVEFAASRRAGMLRHLGGLTAVSLALAPLIAAVTHVVHRLIG